CLHQAAKEFLPIEVLPAAVLLHDIERHRLDPLVGREALGALQALPAPADRLAGIRVPGIDHLQVDVTTIWALHLRPVSQILCSSSKTRARSGKGALLARGYRRPRRKAGMSRFDGSNPL